MRISSFRSVGAEEKFCSYRTTWTFKHYEISEWQQRVHISYVKCDKDESHHAEVYCTTCFTNFCQQCASKTHKSKTLSKHKQIPISEWPKVNRPCLLHPSHVLEFACLEDMCREQPLMCYICTDYGKHKGHKHVLIENEAENIRKSIINAVQHVNVFSGEVTEFGRKLIEITEKIEG